MITDKTTKREDTQEQFSTEDITQDNRSETTSQEASKEPPVDVVKVDKDGGEVPSGLASVEELVEAVKVNKTTEKVEQAKPTKSVKTENEEAEQAKPAENEEVEVDQAKPAENEEVEVEQEKPAENEEVEVDQAKPAKTENEEVEQEKPAKTENEKIEQAKPEKPAKTENEEIKQAKPAEPVKTENEKIEQAKPAENEEIKQPVAAVDFSDEDAELDADNAEYDLGDESEEEEQERDLSPEREFNFENKSKQQLIDTFALLLDSKPVQSLRRDVEAIKVAFYKLHRVEVDALHKKFTEQKGDAEEFTPPIDALEQRLKELFTEYRKRRDEFISKLDQEKEHNHKNKLQIIEDLKALINSTETMNVTFNSFRALQQRWRDSGAVGHTSAKDLWDTYNHHVENFYSYVQINKELRDLDLKRNYEAKIILCEESEALILDPSVVSAFHKLQKLHNQWRETGPVAKEYKDVLWERFKEASVRINKQHQDFFEELKQEQKRNLALKRELCVKTDELADGLWTSRKEWNRASDKLLEIQKVWKTIGFAPKKENTKIYERFRKACDKFFNQKRLYFAHLKSEMDHNLELKNELCEAVEALQNSEEWSKTTNELIALQKRWKEIGPITRRHSDAVWKRFRKACDMFFTRKAEHFAGRNSEQDDNLLKKRALLERLEGTDIAEGGFEMVKAFQREWGEVGFVPFKQKDEIQREYKEAMDRAFSMLRGSGKKQGMDSFKSRIGGMKGGGGGGGGKQIDNERDKLYNRVKQLEADIQLLENNIGFFSKSKNAEAMIADVRAKIDRAREQMEEAIEKIDLIDARNSADD